MKIKIEASFSRSEKQFCLFSLKLFSFCLDFPYPDYISIFSTTFKGSNEYGAVSALGRTSRYDKIIIKLFKDSQNISIYKEELYEGTLNSTNFIKDILNIELYNPIEDNE